MPRAYGFAENGFDLALNTTALPDSNLVIKKLSPITYIPAVSTSYKEIYGIPEVPSDVKLHRCLVHVHNPEWRFVSEQHTATVRVDPTFSSNCYLVLKSALASGLGIGIVPAAVVAQELRSGAVTTLFNSYEVPEQPLCLSFMPDRNRPKRVSCVIDFLAAWFRRYPLSMPDLSDTAQPADEPVGQLELAAIGEPYRTK